MKKFLITGASGYLGKNFVNSLTSTDIQAYVLLRESSSTEGLAESANIIKFKETEEIFSLFKKEEFDCVVHFATKYVHGNNSTETLQMLNANLTFGSVLLTAMREQKKKNFINISTTAEYNTQGEECPNSFYASTKQAFRKILDYHANCCDFNTTTLFFYDTYGPNDPRKKVFYYFLNSLKDGSEIKMSPGEQYICPIHVDDVTNGINAAIDLLLRDAAEQRYFIAGPEKIKLKEVADIMIQQCQLNGQVNWGALPYRPNENMNPYIGQSLPNWEPKISFQDGIREIYENNQYIF